jgi:predicted DNA-binding transcriptional regulator AlpA
MDELMLNVESTNRKLSVRETAAYLCVSKSWLDKRRLDGNGPTYLKLGRRVVYDVVDLESWAADNKRRHTAEKRSTNLRG